MQQIIIFRGNYIFVPTCLTRFYRPTYNFHKILVFFFSFVYLSYQIVGFSLTNREIPTILFMSVCSHQKLGQIIWFIVSYLSIYFIFVVFLLKLTCFILISFKCFQPFIPDICVLYVFLGWEKSDSWSSRVVSIDLFYPGFS